MVKIGDIFLAKIYFTDGIHYKLRPILIIKKNSFGDYIYIPFTTNKENKYSIKFTNEDLKNGKFNKISYLIIDKTCTIQEDLLDRKIADIKQTKLEEILYNYCNYLNSN